MGDLNVNSTMKRIWRAVEVAAWTAFFAFAVLLLALRFWILPRVAEHREEIAVIAARMIGQPVKIGGIEAGWLGLRPQLSLSNVRILDNDGRDALVLPALDNVLSWSSLLHGEIRLSTLRIDRPRLTVRRDAAGEIYVAGLKLRSGADGRGFSDWLLGHEEIVIRNAEIEWRDEKRGAPPLALSALNLRVRNAGDEHAIGLVARPPAALGSQLELRAQLAGRTLTDPSAWSGKLYAELGATDLAAWRAWLDYPLDVREAHGALRLWATLEAGALTEATADVALVQVLALLGPELPALELTTLQGRLQARALRDGYELSARGLTLVPVSGPPLQPTDFQVTWGGDAAEQHGVAAARLIEFEPLLNIAGALPLPADVRARIAELGPSGRISDARLEWQGRFASPQRFSARARFSDLGINALPGMPGFAGLSGTLEASEKKGQLYLASRKAEIELPEVFPDARIGLDTPTATVVVAMMLLGAGLGLVMQVLVIAVQNTAPHGDLGVATSSSMLFRLVGGSIGTAVSRRPRDAAMARCASAASSRRNASGNRTRGTGARATSSAAATARTSPRRPRRGSPPSRPRGPRGRGRAPPRRRRVPGRGRRRPC